jgi:filamentous hemagglutinin
MSFERWRPRTEYTRQEKVLRRRLTRTGKPRVRSDKNARLAGQRHPETGIVFDDRGFPIFDDVAAFDTRIASDAAGVANRRVHMVAASKQLDEAIKRGERSAAGFSQKQLEAIENHLPEIPGYTWHHHQIRGRMQLVPTDIHDRTGHIGGFKEWFQ